MAFAMRARFPKKPSSFLACLNENVYTLAPFTAASASQPKAMENCPQLRFTELQKVVVNGVLSLLHHSLNLMLDRSHLVLHQPQPRFRSRPKLSYDQTMQTEMTSDQTFQTEVTLSRPKLPLIRPSRPKCPLIRPNPDHCPDYSELMIRPLSRPAHSLSTTKVPINS